MNLSSGRTEINDMTNPSSFLTYGEAGGLNLYNVGEAGETIEFSLMNFFINTELVSIMDNGDGDGIANPGESIVIEIQFSNNSSDISVLNLHGEVSSVDDVLIPYPNFQIDELIGNGIGSTFIEIVVSEDINLGDVELSISITGEYDENGSTNTYSGISNLSFSVSLNQFGFPFETENQVWTSPAVIDINGDGTKEIIFADYSGIVKIIDNVGNELHSFDTGNQVWGSPAIHDLDNDGELEIVINSKSKHMYILDNELNVELDYNAEQWLMGTPALGNIDDDEDLEIIFGGYDSEGKIFAVNYDGTDVEGFPFVLGEKIQRGVAIADFNNNGLVDIVCGTDDENVYLIYDDTTIADGFPFHAEGDFRTAPTIFQFPDWVRILIGSKDNTFYQIRANGSLDEYYETGDNILTSVTAVPHGDVHFLFFGSKDGFLYGIDSVWGEDLYTFPKYLGGHVVASPAIADINSNGSYDIITATNEGNLFIFSEEGNENINSPIHLGSPITGSAAIDDIDDDGDLEIMIGTGDGLSITDIKSNGVIDDLWSMHRGNLRRTGYYYINLGDINDELEISKYKLQPAFPNPFNPKTTIGYSVPSSGAQNTTLLQIIDVNGRLIETLVNEQIQMGYHEVIWDASDLSSGIYFAKLTVNSFIQTQKIMLLK